MDRRIVAFAGTLFGLLVGSAVGYYVAAKKLEQEYEEEFHTQVEKLKEYYGVLYKKKEGYRTPEEMLNRLAKQDETEFGVTNKELDEVVTRLRYKGKEREVQTVNVFDREPPAEDVPSLSDHTRLLTADEFMNTEVGYEQFTLTFFTEEGVLAEENDSLVSDIVDVIGVDNEQILNLFGQLSEDEKTFYLRNDKLELDYEVVLFRGSYNEFVLGLNKTPE